MPFPKVSHKQSEGLGKDLDMVQHGEETQMLKSKGRNSEDAVTHQNLQRITAPGSNRSGQLRPGCLVT